MTETLQKLLDEGVWRPIHTMPDSKKDILWSDHTEKEREANAPDSTCKMEMQDGTYYLFSIDYPFKNRPWSFEIWAKSEQEAWQRIDAIKHLPVDVRQVYGEMNI